MMQRLKEANEQKLLIWRHTKTDGFLPFTEYQPSYKERAKKFIDGFEKKNKRKPEFLFDNKGLQVFKSNY